MSNKERIVEAIQEFCHEFGPLMFPDLLQAWGQVFNEYVGKFEAYQVKGSDIKIRKIGEGHTYVVEAPGICVPTAGSKTLSNTGGQLTVAPCCISGYSIQTQHAGVQPGTIPFPVSSATERHAFQVTVTGDVWTWARHDEHGNAQWRLQLPQFSNSLWVVFMNPHVPQARSSS